MSRSSEPYPRSPTGLRLSGGMLAAVLATGCGSTPERTPLPPPSEVVVAPYIKVYEDPKFTRLLGSISSFEIVCADYKDPAVQDIRPDYVTRYKVIENDHIHEVPFEGWVNPLDQHVPVNSGSAPGCPTPVLR
jgi:hypothetical protein